MDAAQRKRPNRSAAERRAPQARADARFANRLLRLVTQTHRGFRAGRLLTTAAEWVQSGHEEPWVRATAAHDPAPWPAPDDEDMHCYDDEDAHSWFASEPARDEHDGTGQSPCGPQQVAAQGEPDALSVASPPLAHLAAPVSVAQAGTGQSPMRPAGCRAR